MTTRIWRNEQHSPFLSFLFFFSTLTFLENKVRVTMKKSLLWHAYIIRRIFGSKISCIIYAQARRDFTFKSFLTQRWGFAGSQLGKCRTAAGRLLSNKKKRQLCSRAVMRCVAVVKLIPLVGLKRSQI
jgi:hypothetical protein